MAIQNRETTLPGIWAENAQTDIPTPPVAGVTYRDTTLNSTAIDKAWPFKTIVDSSDFNQHAFLQDTLIKEAEQYGVMRWNNTTTYKEGGFCLGQDGKLYQALRDNKGKAPTANADDWKVFTSGGGFPIGSIGYTLRTEVPEGGAWCDGAEYTQAMFPDIYQMLVDGKIQSTTVTDFDSKVSANGSCGFFGLDTANERFKVPLLKDVYLKAGQAPSMFGAESLPNITGTAYNILMGLKQKPYGDGALNATKTGNEGVSGSDYYRRGNISFDASGSSSTYQDGAKVNPDHVTYRAYVVLYASAAEASVAQAAEFMTALGGKANVALDNVSPAQSFKDMSIGWGMPDYSAGVSVELPYTAPYNGFFMAHLTYNAGNIYLYVNNIKVQEVGGGATAGMDYMLPVSKGDKITRSSTETYYNAIFYPCKGVN